jgi:ABC-type uncharacterized transport system auxiliary subunit
MRRSTLCALLALTGVLCACTSLMGGKTEIRQRRKFIIEPLPLRLALPNSARPYPYRVEIKKFSVSRVYDNNKIVYRLSPHEIRETDDELWAVRPSEMVTDAVEQYLRDARLFTDIRQEFLDAAPDFTLTGTVKAIERYDSGDLWFARLNMSIRLVSGRSELIWEREFGQEEEQVFNRDFSYTVETMATLLRDYMDQAVREIDLQVHIRLLQSQDKPYGHLLATFNGEDVAQDTVAAPESTIPGVHPHYELIPGKLAPDSD